MGNVSLKVLEKSLNFLFKNGYEPWIDHFQYNKIHAWHWGLGQQDKRNVLFITEPQDDFFCFIPPRLAAVYEY